MHFLKWYSPIVVSLSLLGVLIVPSENRAIDWWAIVLYLPIAVYLWILILDLDKKK